MIVYIVSYCFWPHGPCIIDTPKPVYVLRIFSSKLQLEQGFLFFFSIVNQSVKK